MSGTENDSRRALWSAIATTTLPLPTGLTIMGHPAIGQWATMRFYESRPDLVDVWAAAHRSKASYGPVINGKGHKQFRSYAARIELAGWSVELVSFVDTAAVKP